jgi:hypothetical protein
VTLSLLNRDAPDIRPDNPAFFDIRYPAGYQIALPDIRPDIRLMISKNLFSFPSKKARKKKCAEKLDHALFNVCKSL